MFYADSDLSDYQNAAADAVFRLSMLEKAVSSGRFTAPAYLSLFDGTGSSNLYDRLEHLDRLSVHPRHYLRRLEKAVQALSALHGSKGNELLTFHLFADEVFAQVEAFYKHALPASTRRTVRERWLLEVNEGRESSTRFAESSAFEPAWKMLLDLRSLMRKRLTPPEAFRALTMGSEYSIERDLLKELFTLKQVRGLRLLLVPEKIYGHLEGTEHVRVSRRMRVENDPVLLETMKVLWDEQFEENFGSLRSLVETSRNLI